METRTNLSRRLFGIAACTLVASQAVATHVMADTGGSATVATAVTSADEQWRGLFRQATEAFEEQRLDDAKSLLLQAGAIKMTPQIIANLAQVELQLGEFRAAATHATAALAALGSNAGTEEDLATAAKQVGKLVLRVHLAGAKVVVDEEEVGVTPLTSPIFVEPGTHRVSVSKPGFVAATREFAAEKGSEQSYEIELLPDTAAAPAAPVLERPVAQAKTGTEIDTVVASDAAGTAPRARREPLVLVSGGVLTVAGLVTGIYFNAKAKSESDKGDALLEELGRDSCNRPRSSRVAPCSQLMDHRESQDKARNWSTAGFVLGGAALIGTATYWLWSGRTSHRSAKHLRVDGNATPQGTWISLAGEF